MKSFTTLLWLEYRRSRTWAAALLGSLLFWWWGLHQVRVVEAGEQLGIRAGLLAAASLVGIIVLALMIGRIRGETRGGQFQVLLLSPPSGYSHLLARLTFAIAVAFIYALCIGALAAWAGSQAGVVFTTRSLVDMLLGLPVYILGILVAPILAWTVLLMVFSGAYRISSLNWVPGTVMVLATPFVMRHVMEWTIRAFYTLQGWRFLDQFAIALFRDADTQIEMYGDVPDAQFLFTASDQYIGFPQELLWISVLTAAVMLALAGRIWQEVEA